MKKIRDYIVNFINGFCMALADSVPGVSGGTVVFILGFYEKFIISLDDLTSFKIAREMKEKIESQMQYPGTIKITVIRETRAQEEAK